MAVEMLANDLNENSVDTEEANYFDDLPYEIVVKIFSYLSCKELKRAKLVCLKWYEISEDISLIKRQKFVFRGLIYENQFHLMFDNFSSGREFYNFEFRETTLTDEFETFIESYVDKIHSLFFIDCKFSSKIIEKLMLRCVNLERLCFRSCDCYSDDFDIIANMGPDGIIRPKLEYLEFSSCHWMSDYIFNLFISVYIYVKKIVFNDVRMNCDFRIFRRFYPYNQSMDEFASDCVVTYFAFYKNISRKCKQIEKIILKSPLAMCGPADEYLIEFASTPNIRLKQFKLIQCDRPNSFDTFKTFITHQMNLTSVEFDWQMFSFDNFRFLLSHIPNLESLAVHFNNQTIPRDEFVRLLSKSRLKKFKCYISWYKFITDGSIDSENFPVNSNMRHLHFSLMDTTVAFIPGYIITKLLTIFHNLEYLYLHFKNFSKGHESMIPELIFQKQVHLKTLILNDCLWINNFAFENTKLPYLEYLELNNCDITGKAIAKFEFPRLKVLRINGCKPTEYDLEWLPRNTPSLERLRISDLIFKDRLEYFCQELKFLEHLVLDLCHIDRPKDIFKCCPSLRYLKMKSYDFLNNCIEDKIIMRDFTKGENRIIPWQSDAITDGNPYAETSYDVSSFLYFYE